MIEETGIAVMVFLAGILVTLLGAIAAWIMLPFDDEDEDEANSPTHRQPPYGR